jgi:hypothetical protein
MSPRQRVGAGASGGHSCEPTVWLAARPNGTPTLAAARGAEGPHVQRAALAQNVKTPLVYAKGRHCIAN